MAAKESYREGDLAPGLEASYSMNVAAIPGKLYQKCRMFIYLLVLFGRGVVFGSARFR